MTRRSSVAALLTGAAVLVAGGLLAYQQRGAASRPPVITREVSGSRLGIAPTPEFLLRHQEALQLTPAQRASIERIAQQYRRDLAPAQAKLETAARQYQQYLAKAGGQRPSAKDLAARGAEVSRLSGIIAVTRHSYWQQARSVLTRPQQLKADELAASASARDLS